MRIRWRTAVLCFAIGPRWRGATAPEKRARLQAVCSHEAFDSPSTVLWCDQQHSQRTIDVTGMAGTGRAGGCRVVGAADALITGDVGVGVAVWTADCVPVLIATEQLVAAVHAGWRGVANGLPAAVVAELRRRGAARPRVWVGPAIGADHYPVGPEVHEALAARGAPAEVWQAGTCVDLRAALRSELEGMGCQVAMVGGCTACDLRAASYRRDGASSGRQWSMVLRTAPVS